MKILLVEDDNRIAETLASILRDRYYTVEIAGDGERAWSLASAFTYDLILLDVMLPKIDGITLTQRWRAAGKSTPILILTAKNTSRDKVLGLDVGADDYVVKPFDLPELLARIRALLRRGDRDPSLIFKWGLLQLDPNRCESEYNGVALPLTPKEYSLLELFLRHPRRLFSRPAILDRLWSFEDPPGEETVKVHIRSLRKKLQAAGAPSNFIQTVYGLGYRLNQHL
jgi:DNA-binding response OmpR family regulator